MNSQKIWKSLTVPAQVQVDWVSALSGVSRCELCEFLHLSKKISALISTCKGKKVYLTGYIDHASGWPNTLQKMVNTKQTQSSFYRLFISYCSKWAIFVSLVICVHIMVSVCVFMYASFLILFISFSFEFVFLKEKGHGVEEVSRIWEEWGGKSMIKI